MAKVSIGSALALALLFVLPWVALHWDFWPLNGLIEPVNLYKRISFLAVSTFVGSILFFQFHFFTARMGSLNWSGHVVLVLTNMAMVGLYSIVLLGFASVLFEIRAANGLMYIYIIRNLINNLICFLVVQVLEKSLANKHSQINITNLSQEKAEIELAMLKCQLDPHFLFNCLNTLSGLVRQNKKEALPFLEHFSETFRYTLELHRDHLVQVKKELHFVHSYVYLLKLRFSDTIQVEIEVGEEDQQRKVPQFAIQLLLENAVKHNMISQDSPLYISITSDGRAVTVQNRRQQKPNSQRNLGIGLSNLRKRYELLGHSGIVMDITEEYFTIHLTLL